ncbi:hypothetical protein PG637_10200 [Riemerella anatipestifer]|nr:hypothetical protein [Riemerella anatipestifer]MDY3326038.1 hypothetical protein [Riemerella anatipestifer]MDY3354388.1 hypothetical protein [Riemerella anatipestifer]
MKSDRFVCVNDSIDFPKRIECWKNGEKIKATILGDDLSIPFEFKRIKQILKESTVSFRFNWGILVGRNNE